MFTKHSHALSLHLCLVVCCVQLSFSPMNKLFARPGNRKQPSSLMFAAVDLHHCFNLSKNQADSFWPNYSRKKVKPRTRCFPVLWSFFFFFYKYWRWRLIYNVDLFGLRLSSASVMSDGVPTFFVALCSVGGTLSVLINFPAYCIVSVNLPLWQYLVLLFSHYFAVRTSRKPIFMGLGDVTDHWREF